MNHSLRAVPSILLETGRFLSMSEASSSLERSRLFLRATSLSQEKIHLSWIVATPPLKGDVSRSLSLSFSLIAATPL